MLSKYLEDSPNGVGPNEVVKAHTIEEIESLAIATAKLERQLDHYSLSREWLGEKPFTTIEALEKEFKDSSMAYLHDGDEAEDEYHEFTVERTIEYWLWVKLNDMFYDLKISIINAIRTGLEGMDQKGVTFITPNLRIVAEGDTVDEGYKVWRVEQSKA